MDNGFYNEIINEGQRIVTKLNCRTVKEALAKLEDVKE